MKKPLNVPLFKSCNVVTQMGDFFTDHERLFPLTTVVNEDENHYIVNVDLLSDQTEDLFIEVNPEKNWVDLKISTNSTQKPSRYPRPSASIDDAEFNVFRRIRFEKQITDHGVKKEIDKSGYTINIPKIKLE